MKMEVICWPRRTGKTTKLIRVAAKHFSYMVCINEQEAGRVFKQAKEMGLDIPYPITMDEFIDGRFYVPGMKSFVVDNCEFVISKLARGVPLAGISITIPDPDPEAEELKVGVAE